MNISRDVAKQMAATHPGNTVGNYTVVENRFTEQNRWTGTHELVVKDSGNNLYRTFYEVGLTEHQTEKPFEYAGETVLFESVVPNFLLHVNYVKQETDK